MKESAIFIFILLFCYYFTCGRVSAQSPSAETGLPFIQNYLPETCGGDAQNWDIVQDNQGIVYAANAAGILQYDGQTWRIIPSPDNSWVWSLEIDDKGTIYFGATGDFGYLKTDSSGTLKTTSLADQPGPARELLGENRDFGRVRSTIATKQGIYFQSDHKLFRWSDNHLKVWNSNTDFHLAFSVNDVLYIQQEEIGLLKMSGDTLKLLRDGQQFLRQPIYAILPYENDVSQLPGRAKDHLPSPRDGTILIATHTDGLFLYDGSFLHPFPTELDDFLKENRILNAASLPDGNYALATLRGGVVIMNQQGKFLSRVDRQSGLLSNDVKCIYMDLEGDLWLGLQTGIARVEYRSPLSYFNEQTGLFGSIGSITRHQGTLYIGSSQGVFYFAPRYEENFPGNRPSSARQKTNLPLSRFLPAPVIEASCRGLLSLNQSLLAATSDGVYEIKDSTAILLPAPSNKELHCLSLYHSKYDTNRVFVGLTGGVAVLNRAGEKWINKGQVVTTGSRVFSIIEENPERLWLETRSGRAIRVDFPSTGFRDPQFELLGAEAGLPGGSEVHLVLTDSRLYAYTPGQIFRFEETSRRFIPDSIVGIPFTENCSYYSFIINGERGSVWREINNRVMRIALKDNTGQYRWLNESFAKIRTGIWSFYIDNDGTIWFGGDNILFRYTPEIRKNYRVDFSALVRRVTVMNLDSVIFSGAALVDPTGRGEGLPADNFIQEQPGRRGEGLPADNFIREQLNSQQSFAPTTLSYTHNALRFECAAPAYDDPSANQFQYFLEGFDKGWSRWSPEAKKEYTNIPEGKYVFRVRARNAYGQQSNEAAYAFKILSPWYGTWWAYLFYLMAAAVILYSLRRYELNRLRLKNQLKMERFEGEKLKELDQMKSRFFANISHEFRTPLTLILGPVEQIAEETPEGDTRSKLQLVKRNARRLQRLIDQLLDLSSLESGKMQLRVAPGNIVEFLNGLTMSFASLAERKQISLQFHSKEEKIEPYFDRDKMEKILTNLLSNALKFTPAGGEVIVDCSISDLGFRIADLKDQSQIRNPQSEMGDFVEITVRDSGVGISPDHLPYIFDRFYQAGHSRVFDPGQPGTGIGLALVKELVELHRGSITVNSREGQGTTFTVFLPSGKGCFNAEEIITTSVTTTSVHLPGDFSFDENGSPEVAEEPETAAACKEEEPLILVVEDHADFRAYIREQLQPAYQVIEAEDGAAGLELALEAIPDLVISDVMMPKMNGFGLCAALKTDERSSHIPVILLTARTEQQDKIEGLEYGADDYLSKPFNAKELLARVKNLIELRRKLRERFTCQVVLKPAEIAIASADEIFLKKALAAVEAHIDDEKFDVESLQREVSMSRTQLHRKLKALTGQSATEFIRSIRLHRAADLLKANAGSVAEIAYMAGFNSQAYFTRCFREQFGMSPKAYAKKG